MFELIRIESLLTEIILNKIRLQAFSSHNLRFVNSLY